MKVIITDIGRDDAYYHRYNNIVGLKGELGDFRRRDNMTSDWFCGHFNPENQELQHRFTFAYFKFKKVKS